MVESGRLMTRSPPGTRLSVRMPTGPDRFALTDATSKRCALVTIDASATITRTMRCRMILGRCALVMGCPRISEVDPKPAPRQVMRVEVRAMAEKPPAFTHEIDRVL